MRLQRARPIRRKKRRSRSKSRSAKHYSVPPLQKMWSGHVKLGQHLRVNAKRGYRAAIVELRPGLWLVAAVKEETLRTEVGVLPLLAPLLITAASRALKQKKPILPKALSKDEPPVDWADSDDVQAMQEKGECGC